MAEKEVSSLTSFNEQVAKYVRAAQEKGGKVFDVSSICNAASGAAIIIAANGSVDLTMWNEGGYNSTSVNLSDLIALLQDTPELASLVPARRDQIVDLEETKRKLNDGD